MVYDDHCSLHHSNVHNPGIQGNLDVHSDCLAVHFPNLYKSKESYFFPSSMLLPKMIFFEQFFFCMKSFFTFQRSLAPIHQSWVGIISNPIYPWSNAWVTTFGISASQAPLSRFLQYCSASNQDNSLASIPKWKHPTSVTWTQPFGGHSISEEN